MPYADPTSEQARLTSAEKSKRWRDRHPEKVKESQKRYNDKNYAENSEILKARVKARLEQETPEQRETRLARMRDYAAARRDNPEVKAAAREATRKWREENPERARLQNREQQRKRRAALATRPRPDNCECCGKPGGEHKPHRLHYDHDHKTGAWRGWLCHSCNCVLGFVDDNIEQLRQCIVYLQGHAT